MSRLNAAQRFALALAGHLHGGGGVSARSVSVLAGHVGVSLVDAAAEPDGERPVGTTVTVSAPCRRCGRTLSHPLYVEGLPYGPKCVRRVRATLAREPYYARNAGEST